MLRHVNYVTALAKGADARGFHFGAVVFRGNDILSTGWCQCKTHPRQAQLNRRHAKKHKRSNSYLHAEVHSLINAKCDCSDYDMIVARWACGKLRPSHPCDPCMIALRAANIRRLWYMSDTGEWTRKKV